MTKRHRFLAAIALMTGTQIFFNAQSTTNLPVLKAGSPEQKPPVERFDDRVRDDFFAGFMNNDEEALNRGLKTCAETLAKNPRHAEAMVWHGSGVLTLASKAFQAGDTKKGLDLWQRGLKEMSDAVAWEPNNVAVLIPRGATLLPASRYVPDPAQAKQLLKTGVDDYEKILELQKSYFEKLPVHARGELLFGLADGWYRLGDPDKSQQYLKRIAQDCAGSRYAERAGAWLGTTDAKGLREKSNALSCTGCHEK